jgi:hypothetical protein
MFKTIHHDPKAMEIDARSQRTGGATRDRNDIPMFVGSGMHPLKMLASGGPEGCRAAAAVETTVGRRASLSNETLGFAGRQQADGHLDLSGEIDRDLSGEIDRDVAVWLARGPPI